MKITQIRIINFLGISSFKISRLGKFNRITGDNGVGKSAVRDAITEALRSSGVDPRIIKTGENKAEILIEIDGRINVERQITPSANRVKVVVDGQPMSAPQRFLNGLFGTSLIFNPVDFFLAKPKERRRILLSSIDFTIDQAALLEALGDTPVPIDITTFDYSGHGLEVLERIRQSVYEQRHEIGVGLTRLKKSIEQDQQSIPDTFNGQKFADFDINDAVSRLSDLKASITQHETDQKRLEELRHRAVTIKEQLVNLEKELDQVQQEGVVLGQKVAKFNPPEVNTLQGAVEEYNAHQELVHAVKNIRRRQEEYERIELSHQHLDDFHVALSTDVPHILLAQIKLPIDNLEIKSDDILVDGVSIDKFSTSEEITFGVRLARSLAGDLKIICVDRYESLSVETRKLFEAEAKGDGFEYFITEVTDGPLTMAADDDEPAQEKQTKLGGRTNAGF